MKFTKFIPVALALTLCTPAFAAPESASLSAQSDLSISVPHYVYISKSEETASASASFNASYDEITLDKFLGAKFTVVTNKATADQVQFTAECDEDGTTVKALGGTKDALILAFTKDNDAPADAVSNALGASSDVTLNGNCIAFALTPTPTIKANSGATAVTTYDIADGVVTYTLPTAGEYYWTYKMAKNAKANTFDTHDTHGTYKCTIKMTHAGLTP